ncbi:MAG: transposase [Acidobacteriota bacterium]|nr:transposase [Acidobacteriota bacterium]
MRRDQENQSLFSGLWPDPRLIRELKAVSKIFDGDTAILDLVSKDLCDTANSGQWAPSLSAEQVLRVAILKSWHHLSYTDLAFHLIDSQSFRRFACLPRHETLSASRLRENIGRIQPATWQRINRLLDQRAARQGLERVRKRQADATTVESPTDYPPDSQLSSDPAQAVTQTLLRLARQRMTNSRNRRR